MNTEYLENDMILYYHINIFTVHVGQSVGIYSVLRRVFNNYVIS